LNPHGLIAGGFFIAPVLHRNAWSTRNTLGRIAIEYQYFAFYQNPPWNTICTDNQHVSFSEILADLYFKNT